MTDTLDQAISKLQESAKLPYGGSAKVIDQALAEVMLYHDKRCIESLLLLLDDAIKQDEGMFSIIHAVESFDDITYVNELLAVLPLLCKSAPKWGSIVMMRGMNNRNTRDVMVGLLRGANSEIKDSAIWLCNKINERSPSFLDRTLPVLLAAQALYDRTSE